MLHRAGGKAVSLDELAARRKVTEARIEVQDAEQALEDLKESLETADADKVALSAVWGHALCVVALASMAEGQGVLVQRRLG